MFSRSYSLNIDWELFLGWGTHSVTILLIVSQAIKGLLPMRPSALCSQAGTVVSKIHFQLEQVDRDAAPSQVWEHLPTSL